MEGDETEANLPILNLIADELDNDGRVKPIAWSMTDPEFRKAVDSGLIRDGVDYPEFEDIRVGAQKLKVEYILIVSALRRKERLVANAVLFRLDSARPAWKDEKNLSVVVSDRPDWESTARSLARTWLSLLANGPLKGLKPKPRQEVPDPNLGPADRDPTPPENPSALDPELFRRVDELKRADRFADAINLLRDAIDLEPTNYPRREALVKLLLERDMAEQAVQHAERTLQLMPDKTEMRFLAARGYLGIDKPTDAQRLVNEALSRGLDTLDLQILLGEILLAKQEAPGAIAAFTRGLKEGNRFDARAGRAIAYALDNDPVASRRDILALGGGDARMRQAGYDWLASSTQRAVERIAQNLREALQLARLNPKDAGAIQKAKDAEKLATTLASLIEQFPVPDRHKESHQDRHKESHQGRLLAQKLLVQAASETLEFARLADADTGVEATLSLGEAMKQFQTVKSAFADERSKGP